MGFRNGAYATVWEVIPVSNLCTKIRMSINRKTKDGEYETDFSGYVSCIGEKAAKDAMSLKEKDRIRLGDVDVSTNYDKGKNVTYTNYKLFSFEDANGGSAGSNNAKPSDNQKEVEDGSTEDLPF